MLTVTIATLAPTILLKLGDIYPYLVLKEYKLKVLKCVKNSFHTRSSQELFSRNVFLVLHMESGLRLRIHHVFITSCISSEAFLKIMTEREA
jgi:hypothetical protein